MVNRNSIEKRESVKKDYDIIADAYAEEFGKEYEDIDVINEFMSKLEQRSKILDLGGGTGKLTDLFIKNNYEAICYDFSKEMMRKSREYFGELPFILDDMLNVKSYFENESLDGVIAFYSLFHIPREDINTLFADIHDILKNNGVFCFVVQLGNEEGYIDEPYLKEQGKNVLYMNFFTKNHIDQLLKSNGFETIYETTKDEVAENELGNESNKKIFIIARKGV
ncbi:MAG: class I SAM-dependent methyltransferase [Clostridia bacterium]|nr:class I SAM-dependent methyltransferase [Clostridia bacterium]